MTGGGSGGHITPILAVAHELKLLHPEASIIYVGQKGDAFGEIVAENTLIDEVYTVYAGKFRRYHGEGWRQLLDIKTVALNVRDMFLVVFGALQSYRLFGRLKPDVLFCKGGFVGVPVGLAAALRRVPYLTHDSDAMPGLANRIIARWAALHAVALSPELYPYPKDETINVGVPVAAEYHLVSDSERQKLREELGLSAYKQIVLVTGGGLGAARLNTAAVASVPALLHKFPELAIVHTTGATQEAAVREQYETQLTSNERPRVVVMGYTTKLYAYSAVSDVVVARGGATNLAELAAQGKACIIVPNPLLTGGHQLKNAASFEEKGAILQLDESKLGDNYELLVHAVSSVLGDATKRAALETKLHEFARPKAAQDLAEAILRLGEGKHGAV